MTPAQRLEVLNEMIHGLEARWLNTKPIRHCPPRLRAMWREQEKLAVQVQTEVVAERKRSVTAGGTPVNVIPGGTVTWKWVSADE